MNRILITGADGHLGYAIADWLLRNTERELVLWVRAGDEALRQRKLERLHDLLQSERCHIAWGDLDWEEPFVDVDPDAISEIIHSAAAIDFNIPRDLAERVNLNGTRRLLEFARHCPGLRRCALLSTLYSAGLRDGRLTEVLHDDNAPFANHYEWSKWHSERLLAEEFNTLPWQVLRVATIVADDAQGQVAQQNVVHNTMRLMYYGLLSILPGIPDTRIYLTTTDFAAEACSRLLLEGPDRRIFHLSDDAQHALRLGQLLDQVYRCFGEDRLFRRSGILKPLYCSREAFEVLVSGIGQQSDVIGQALASVAPFAPQLFSDKQVCTRNLSTCLPDLNVPDMQIILPAVSRNLVATRWKNTTAGSDGS